jgi:aspartate racemase
MPILHIADVTADALKAAGIGKVALLSTRYTVTQPFLKDRLAAAVVEVIVPGVPGIDLVNRVIYDELCLGVVHEESKAEVLNVINGLFSAGAEGVILGCTELPLLIKAEDCAIPVFDTTTHATAAANRALS